MQTMIDTCGRFILAYAFWFALAGFITSVIIGVIRWKKFIETMRGNAMAAEADKYDASEPVGDIPYQERP